VQNEVLVALIPSMACFG